MGYVVIRRRGQLILLSSAPTVGHVIGSPPRRPTHQENQVARPGKAKTPRAFLGRAGVTPRSYREPGRTLEVPTTACAGGFRPASELLREGLRLHPERRIEEGRMMAE